LFIAAQAGNLEVVRCMVKELGADVNQMSTAGNTPLLIAAQNGQCTWMLFVVWLLSYVLT
jgi:ankyrin repeat protein